MLPIIILFHKSAKFVGSIADHVCISFVKFHPVASEPPYLFCLEFYGIDIQHSLDFTLHTLKSSLS